MQLFLQVARRASPDFTLSPENLPHVAHICRLVGGLPLGIELAAAWVRLFPCQQIADEIERSPDFLRNAGGNTPERQHSLRATFEYSYNLLSEAEQTLFRRLSVFRGGFTVEAAQHVSGANPSALASLLDKSLLQIAPSRRLGVHLTLRDYAVEKLAETAEEERETRERHGHAYLAFVREREASLQGESPREILDEIELELGNVREAWGWAVSQGRLEEIDTSTEGLARFYDLRGLFREAEAAFERAADCVLALVKEDAAALRVACRLRAEQARFLQRQAQYLRVSQVAEAAIELAQAAREELVEARAALLLGEALWRQGNHEAARPQLERALALARAGRDAPGRVTSTVREASARASRPESDEGLSRAVETGSLNILAGLCWVQGDYAGARAYIEQALDIAVNSGNRQDEARFLMNLGVLAVEQGNYAEAMGMF